LKLNRESAIGWIAGSITFFVMFSTAKMIMDDSKKSQTASEVKESQQGTMECGDPPIPGKVVFHSHLLEEISKEAVLRLKNLTEYSRYILFSFPAGESLKDVKNTAPAFGMFLSPGMEKEVRVPVGTYALTIFTAPTMRPWCGPKVGFLDSVPIIVRQVLIIGREETVILSLEDDGSESPYGGRIVLRSEPLPETRLVRTDEGKMLLRRAKDGLFWTYGAVEGMPSVFIVDTGASATVIPRSWALRWWGRYRCRGEETFRTLGGRVKGCRIRVKSLEVGPFRFVGAEVYVVDTEEFPVLGNDILHHLSIRTNGDTMEISSPS